jgi:hypothetical protein
VTSIHRTGMASSLAEAFTGLLGRPADSTAALQAEDLVGLAAGTTN